MANTHILIVEDDPDNQTVFRRFLEYANYRISVASNGADGLAIALRETPNLIVVDLRLPGMNGWDLAEQLKANPRTQSIPLLLITATPLNYNSAPVQITDFDGMLLKPFELHIFLAQIARMLAGGPRRTNQPERLNQKCVGDH